jgi:limonene-1,2-epoxide hydrolase
MNQTNEIRTDRVYTNAMHKKGTVCHVSQMPTKPKYQEDQNASMLNTLTNTLALMNSKMEALEAKLAKYEQPDPAPVAPKAKKASELAPKA